MAVLGPQPTFTRLQQAAANNSGRTTSTRAKGSASSNSGRFSNPQKKVYPSRQSGVGGNAARNSGIPTSLGSSGSGGSGSGSGSGSSGPSLVSYKPPSLNLPSLNAPDAPTYQSEGLTRGALQNRFSDIQVGGAPDLPDQINMDDYNWQEATISDLEEKYGFDYSRDYAARIAEAQAQAQRDEVQTSRERMQQETASAKEDLSHDFFQQFRNQRQEMADSGINAGIASERDLRLDMNRQNALGDILSNQQLRNQELDRNLSTIEQERVAQEDQLFNQRLNQAFNQAMQLTGERRQSALAQLDRAMQQRQQQVSEAWREHENNSMSTSEFEKFIQQVRQQEMANAQQGHDTNMRARLQEYDTRSRAEMQKYDSQMQAALRRAGY